MLLLQVYFLPFILSCHDIITALVHDNIYTEGERLSDHEPQFVIVWRQDVRRLSYNWLPQPFTSGLDHWNTTKENLQQSLADILGASRPLTYETTIMVN